MLLSQLLTNLTTYLKVRSFYPPEQVSPITVTLLGLGLAVNLGRAIQRRQQPVSSADIGRLWAPVADLKLTGSQFKTEIPPEIERRLYRMLSDVGVFVCEYAAGNYGGPPHPDDFEQFADALPVAQRAAIHETIWEEKNLYKNAPSNKGLAMRESVSLGFMVKQMQADLERRKFDWLGSLIDDATPAEITTQPVEAA